MGASSDFDMEARRVYLNELRTHGQKGLAAEAAGVTLQAIAWWKKINDENGTFAAAESLSLELRSQTIVRKLEQEFIDGILEPKIDKEGNVVYWNKPTGHVDEHGEPITVRMPVFIRKVESAARLRVLERHDPAYREHKEVDVNSKSSGVLVVPAVAASMDEWQAAASAAKKNAGL